MSVCVVEKERKHLPVLCKQCQCSMSDTGKITHGLHVTVYISKCSNVRCEYIWMGRVTNGTLKKENWMLQHAYNIKL